MLLSAVVYFGADPARRRLARRAQLGRAWASGADPGIAAEDVVWGATLALPVIAVTASSARSSSASSTRRPTARSAARHSVGFVLNLIAAAIVAPIGEEIFFRGFATTAWQRAIGNNGALIRGAIFFAFVHILTVGGASFARRRRAGPGRLRRPAAVAFALGWVFLRRRSLYASIGLHGAFNASAAPHRRSVGRRP